MKSGETRSVLARYRAALQQPRWTCVTEQDETRGVSSVAAAARLRQLKRRDQANGHATTHAPCAGASSCAPAAAEAAAPPPTLLARATLPASEPSLARSSRRPQR